MKMVVLLLLAMTIAFGIEEPPQELKLNKKRLRIVEPVAPAPKAPAVEPKSAFESLPAEVKNHILSFLTTAKGANNCIRLDSAAENIRSFFKINKSFSSFGQDPQIINYLITELANRFADGDKVVAALALGTQAAGEWLQNTIKNSTPAERLEFKNSIGHIFNDAAKTGRMNVLKFLYHFAESLLDGDAWRNALRDSAENNKIEIVAFLLSLDVENKKHQLSKLAYSKENVLLRAVRNENLEMIKILLDGGFDVNENGYDESALDIAKRLKDSEKKENILKILQKYNARPALNRTIPVNGN